MARIDDLVVKIDVRVDDISELKEYVHEVHKEAWIEGYTNGRRSAGVFVSREWAEARYAAAMAGEDG
jgi:hypothetical protein